MQDQLSCTTPHKSIMLSAALEYARRGLCVLPVEKRDKKASLKDWPANATTETGAIDKWFSIGPVDRNVGVLTGARSRLVVIDVDDYKEGCEFDSLVSELGKLPDTFTVKTGSGGHHFYFQYPEGCRIGNSASKIGKHVDIRADRGYVVAPPSTIALPSGGRGIYVVEKDLPFAELPDKWVEKLTSNSQPRQSKIDDLNQTLIGSKLFELPMQILKGKRNDTLYRYSGHLIAKGVSEEQVLPILLDTNQARCTPPLKQQEVEKIVRSQCNGKASSAEEWQDPILFHTKLKPVPEFDLSQYPDAFQPWIKDSAERMQCPPEYIACSLMVSAAAALGNSIAICPKALDTGWVVTSTLWGAIVGRPGVKKTPALDVGLAHLRIIEEKLLTEYNSRMDDYVREKKAHEINNRVLTGRGNKNIVNSDQIELEPDKPLRERVIVNDATQEKLVEILVGSPRGVLVQLDEITGLFEGFNKKGNEGARSFYLTAWTGQSSYSVDRIGRGSIFVPRVNIFLLGGIQPSKLEKYVREATEGGGNDDGLIQRLQFLVYPDPPTAWELTDRPPDVAANNKVSQAFAALRDINPQGRGATLPMYGDGIPYLQFDSEAQSLFNHWMKWLENKLRDDDYPPAIESHLGKYRSLVPALALLDHLIDAGVGAVTSRSLYKAIRLASFLWKHSLRAYGYRGVREAAAYAIAQKLNKRHLESGFTLRELTRKQWSHLQDRAINEKALELLIERHWLRKDLEHTGGKPKTTYHINPRIYVDA